MRSTAEDLRGTWAAVDSYFGSRFTQDDALDHALRRSAEAGLPPINVTALQGKLLQLLARSVGARRVLEIGTLGGYSTIWLARGLPPGGRLVTLEYEPRHAEVARVNLEAAGVADSVEVVVGAAQATLPRLIEKHEDPFDFVFIDADKVGYADYFRWSLELSHPGTVIVADNVARGGAVVDAAPDESTRGVMRFLDAVAQEKRVDATAIQTVGAKEYDGFLLALVTA